MEIITSHTNADFDALASMIAAKKLYPAAKIVFAGSQEKSMRDFFLESAFYAMEADRLRDVEVEKISRLIVVDNRSPARLGKLANALNHEGISIHIYDHHPAMEGDLRGEFEIVQEVGATTTIMVELLREKNISISSLEATLFALGIYEETGSLTFVSTTKRDAEAVAYLIECGAMLNVVSDFVSRELSPDQVSILNSLIEAAASYDISGVRVVISAADTVHFVPDLANIAHKMREREAIDVLFLVVQTGDKTHLIARSRLPQIHVGNVLTEFGGGGHATAASAVVRDLTYLQAKERLIDILKHQIKPGRLAKEIMTSPVKTLPSGSTIAEAGDVMTRFSVNVLPILEGSKYEGIITREVVQKSLFHGFSKERVEHFMTSGGPTAVPDMPMEQVERMMIEERQRFIPVLEKSGTLVGAITRTDLLRSLHEQRLDDLPKTGEAGFRSIRHIKGLLEERVPQNVKHALRMVGEVADEAGFPVYLVGGIVRDLIMRRPNFDIDIVVEGDGITFADMLVKKHGGRMKAHVKFGTAVVMLPNALKLDIATARIEYYKEPAALPTVELSSIKKDLYRRDFTINTLAVRLNSKRFGELIDFFGGLRDIKDHTIRVLHNLSFVEDPTRVLRAIRFEQRFSFHLSKHTLNLIKTAVAMKVFNRLSGSRIYAEIILMFSEADPLKLLKRMDELDILKFIHVGLKNTGDTELLFSRISETLTWFKLLYLDIKIDVSFIYLLALFDRLKATAFEEALERLSVPPRMRAQMRASRERYPQVLYAFYKESEMPHSRIYDLLHPLETETILFMMAKATKEQARKDISLFLTHLREIKIELTGNDLKKMGLSPGPAYKRILSELLDKKLDGTIATREEELKFVTMKLQSGK